MKSLFVLALLALVAFCSNAFAGPFSGFAGTYKVIETPNITKENIKYCNWINLLNITDLIISQQGDYERVEVISTANANGGKEHVYFNLLNHVSEDQYSKVETVVSGDENQAVHQMKSNTELRTWTMTKTASGAQLEVHYTNSYKGVTGSCHYSINLLK